MFDLIGRNSLPRPPNQPLNRLKVNLVAHLAAFFDPVAEVDIGEFAAFRFGDLPEDAVGAEAKGGAFGVVEGVDRRQAVFKLIHDADHAQHAVVAEFDEPGVDVALQ